MDKKGRCDYGRSVHMLLDIKQAALEAELGTPEHDFLLNTTGCGMLTIARYIDIVIDALNRDRTSLERYKYDYELAHDVEKQWNDLGFAFNPEDMNEKQIAELRSIAERFKAEIEEGVV